LIWLAIVLGHSVGMNAMFGPQAAFYAEHFNTRVRYSGIVLARETTGALLGGPTPFIATALIAWSGGELPLVTVYLAPETLGTAASGAASRALNYR
jgi:MHS family shikimate/dehydroshikimate transporter-like MFS transporter